MSKIFNKVLLIIISIFWIFVVENKFVEQVPCAISRVLEVFTSVFKENLINGSLSYFLFYIGFFLLIILLIKRQEKTLF